MKLYYVHAIDAHGSETAAHSLLTMKEAKIQATRYLINGELRAAGAIRVKIFEEKTNACVFDQFF
jgi:hypothetical protein